MTKCGKSTYLLRKNKETFIRPSIFQKLHSSSPIMKNSPKAIYLMEKNVEYQWQVYVVFSAAFQTQKIMIRAPFLNQQNSNLSTVSYGKG